MNIPNKDNDIIKINLKQYKFSLTCEMIIDEIIDPICLALIQEVDFPNHNMISALHELKIYPLKRNTDALFDILDDPHTTDHLAVEKLIQKSMAEEGALVEQTAHTQDQIGLYRLLQLLRHVLHSAKDNGIFVQFDNTYIDTPLDLGKFVAGLLISKQESLPQDLYIFNNLEAVVQYCQSIDSAGL